VAPLKEIDVLDVTLREGNYVLEGGFTATQTRRIARALEAAGVRYIELGHAWGLNAAACGLGDAAETDDGYLGAAADALTSASFGMFCIAGVTRPEDLRRAASYGMGFARIGANATAIKGVAPLVSAARECGLFVTCNLMKSYTLDAKAFARSVALVQQFGAHVAYLVDSAGGMLPRDVERYCRAVAASCDVPLGFHGHDNLGLAVANTLVAAEAGASMLDGSLQGLGRSGGNAALELLVAVLHRRGITTGIDLIAVMDVGEAHARRLVKERGVSSLNVSIGVAQFHSSFLEPVLAVASEYGVDPRLLICEVCKVDRVSAPPGVVRTAAERIVGRTAAHRVAPVRGAG
jgi:4-hydroxy-2-oxovalerate aldolase